MLAVVARSLVPNLIGNRGPASRRLVAASVSASAARSASLKYGASRQAATARIRSSVSPARFAFLEVHIHAHAAAIDLAGAQMDGSVRSCSPAGCCAQRICSAPAEPAWRSVSGLRVLHSDCMIVDFLRHHHDDSRRWSVTEHERLLRRHAFRQREERSHQHGEDDQYWHSPCNGAGLLGPERLRKSSPSRP